MQKVTISDVAKAANVSVSTVSRVINSNETVNSELRDRVLATIERMGYIPNASARSVRVGSSNLIGIVIPTVRIATFAEVLQGAMDAAMQLGYRVKVYSSGGKEQQDSWCLDSVASSGACGLIYCPIASVGAQSHLEQVRSRGIPIVIAFRKNVVPGLPHVYMDDEMGAYTATKYLLQRGRRRIAFFAGFWSPPGSLETVLKLLHTDGQGAYTTLERMAGYQRALQEYGLDLEKELLTISGFDYPSGYQSMKKFLSTLTDFDAILCGNDLVAAGAMAAMQEQNISVPERVSVVGYDDSELAQIAHPQLTSVRQNPYNIGKRAVEILVQSLRGGVVGDVRLPSELIIRASTAVKDF